MPKIIIPKRNVVKVEEPLIFIAGPIKGSSMWQNNAMENLIKQDFDVAIACPLRYNEVRENLKPYLVDANGEDFPRQRTWEKHYLDIASKTGAVMFWLAPEVTHNCKKSYGATTRWELSQAVTHYMHDRKYSFCVGADPKFPELKVIECDMAEDTPDKKIFGSLEETCKEAVKLAREK